jgi:hypothetical protein
MLAPGRCGHYKVKCRLPTEEVYAQPCNFSPRHHVVSLFGHDAGWRFARQYARAKDRPSGATQASDAAINSRLRAQYAADPGLAKFALGVNTAAGFVTLSGKVATYSARETAEKLAMATDGVKAVDNQISVNYAQ